MKLKLTSCAGFSRELFVPKLQYFLSFFLSTFKYNPAKANTKFITSPVISYRRVQEESGELFHTRFGHSLRSAISASGFKEKFQGPSPRIALCLERLTKKLGTYLKLTLVITGNAKKDWTASSMRGCAFTKFTVTSGSVLESFTHAPGLGSGTFSGSTRSQLLFMVSCSLNAPWKTSRTFFMENAQTAEPPIEFTGVVNTP